MTDDPRDAMQNETWWWGCCAHCTQFCGECVDNRDSGGKGHLRYCPDPDCNAGRTPRARRDGKGELNA